MKTRILLMALMCFCIMAVSVKASPFLQDEQPTEMPEPGKKMNFQGTLYENGEPVTGERSFTFSIDLGNDEVWTETHPNVQVVEGLYAVLLGSIDPMPADLFFDVEERDLTISVGNTVLGTTPLLAPFGLNNGKDFKTAAFDLVVEAETDTAAVTATISGKGLSNNNAGRAIHADARTDSSNTTIFSEAYGGETNRHFQTAVRGNAVTDGPSWAIGVWGVGTGNGGGVTYGLRGEARGVGNGFSASARGLNFVESTDAPISRYGALFDTRFAFNGEASVLGTSYGVAGVARGSEINYGVYGSASGLEGSVNYAGFFQGDVNITEKLYLTREDGFGSELAKDSYLHRGNDTEVNAWLGNNWLDAGNEYENRGALFLFADTTERFNREGADIRRVDLRVKDNGYGGSVGALTLRSFSGEPFKAGVETFDGENHFGSLRLDGPTSNNFNFSASGYPEGNLARMTMSGGLAHSDENGNTYIPELVTLGIDKTTDSEGTEDEKASLELASASFSGRASLTTNELIFRSNDYTANYVSLGAGNDGQGGRAPYLNMQGNLEKSDDQGNTYVPQLVSLNIFKVSETNERSNLILNSTEGANANLSPEGLSINGQNYQPFTINNSDYGQDRKFAQMNMTSGLLSEDESGNTFHRTLINMGINNSGEAKDQASLQLSNTDQQSANLNPEGLTFNDGTGNQNIAINSFDNGFGRRNSSLRMQSGLDITDDNGNTYRPELINLSINSQNETTDFARLSLDATDGRNIGLDRNGLSFYSEGYTPVGINVSDDGSGNVNGSIQLTGSITRMDEGQDFSYNPQLVLLAANKHSEENEVGELTLAATDGSTFSINATDGVTGTSSILRARSMALISETGQNIINITNYGDGQGGELASMTMRDTGENSEDLVRVGTVNETDVFGSVFLGKRNSSTDQFRITANGVFGGTDVFQNGLALNYDGTGGALLRMYANGTEQVLIEAATGNMTITGSLSQSSDARLKKNVETLTSGLSIVNQLRGVRYNWKDEARTGNKVGFIAQEVEAVLPELVVTKKDGFKAVNYAEMTAVLVEAVKELSLEIAELKKENSTLKAELTKAEELESRLEKIEAMLAMDDSKETVKAGQK